VKVDTTLASAFTFNPESAHSATNAASVRFILLSPKMPAVR